MKDFRTEFHLARAHSPVGTHYHKQQNTFALCVAWLFRGVKKLRIFAQRRKQSTIGSFCFWALAPRCHVFSNFVINIHTTRGEKKNNLRFSVFLLHVERKNSRKTRAITPRALFTTSFRWGFWCQANNITGLFASFTRENGFQWQSLESRSRLTPVDKIKVQACWRRRALFAFSAPSLD